MITRLLRYGLLAAYLWILGALCAGWEMPTNKAIVSPDQRFAAKLADDQQGNIHIVDNSSGVTQKVRSFRPLLSLKWSGDSKSLVTIEHLAGGSQTAIIHFDGDKWTRSEVDPIAETPPYHHYTVIKQEVGWDAIRVTYKVTDEKGNGVPFGYYICSFTVDAATGARKNFVKRRINEKEYHGLTYRD